VGITNASNLTPQAGRFFAKHTAQKSVQLATLFMQSVMFPSAPQLADTLYSYIKTKEVALCHVKKHKLILKSFVERP